jgi:DTW domain-containing protein YfiP
VHGSLCICALIPRLETRTRVVLVIHRYEDRKPTNTGRLGTECLVNSEVVVRGHEGEPTSAIELSPDVQPLLLFPYEDAVPIERFAASPRPVTLIVPDGTWRQASKVRSRVPGLRDVPCVSLPRGAASTYRLRFDAHDDGLATIEGMARALRVLEGDRGEEVQRALEGVFHAMVERTLWARGTLGAQQVGVGVPDGVMRHAPRKKPA